MATQPTLTSSVIRFCAGVIASVVCLIPFAPAATAQTTWTVTVDVSNGSDTPTYNVNSMPANADNCTSAHTPQQTDGKVFVCPKDIVKFQAKTAMGNGELALTEPDGILDTGQRDYFHAMEGNTAGGQLWVSATAGGHEYCVAVYDPKIRSQFHVYVDDPQIVIGTGHGNQSLDDIEAKIRKEVKGLHVVRFRDAAAAEKARLQAEQALTELQKLKELLESK